jgi:hypothetical protein
MKRICIAFALLFLPFALRAQVAVQGQVRERSELDNRGIIDSTTVLVHLLRSRIRVTANPTDWVTVVAEVQDSRFLGSGNPALGRGTTDVTADGLDMLQAWGQIDRPLDLPIKLRLGRQQMAFANDRLVGVSNWSNTGRAFDGLRLMAGSDSMSVDAWAMRLSAPTAGPTASQNFYGVWGNVKPIAGLGVDLFAMRDDNTSPILRGEDSSLSVLERYTFGSFVNLSIGPLDVAVEGAGQTGSSAASDTVARREIGAFLASGQLSFLLLPDSRTRVIALASVLSGDGSARDDRNETFNTLFGTNHRVYGTIDYLPELSGNFGVVDFSGQISSAPVKGVRLLLEGHLFQPQRGGGGEKFGTEIDLTTWYRPAPAFELSGGGAIFMPGKLLETRLGGTDMRSWAYVAGQWDF